MTRRVREHKRTILLCSVEEIVLKRGSLFILCLLLLLCTGCNYADSPTSDTAAVSTTQTAKSTAETQKTNPHGKDYTPDEFSQTELENNVEMFSKVTAAMLSVEGDAMPLETDDPRLIRLLNLLSYAVSVQDVAWMQGFADASYVASVEDDANRLEVEFQNGREFAGTFELSEYDRMIVSDRGFLCISYVDEPVWAAYEEGKVAMHLWLDTEDFKWNSKETLSLLEYVGFM